MKKVHLTITLQICFSALLCKTSPAQESPGIALPLGCRARPDTETVELAGVTCPSEIVHELTGMDMVPEESGNISSMLIIDRDAKTHEMRKLVDDVKRARADRNAGAANRRTNRCT